MCVRSGHQGATSYLPLTPFAVSSQPEAGNRRQDVLLALPGVGSVRLACLARCWPAVPDCGRRRPCPWSRHDGTYSRLPTVRVLRSRSAEPRATTSPECAPRSIVTGRPPDPCRGPTVRPLLAGSSRSSLCSFASSGWREQPLWLLVLDSVSINGKLTAKDVAGGRAAGMFATHLRLSSRQTVGGIGDSEQRIVFRRPVGRGRLRDWTGKRGALQTRGTIRARLTDGPLSGSTREVTAVEGRPPKTIDIDCGERTVRYCLAHWEQSGQSATYGFLYDV